MDSMEKPFNNLGELLKQESNILNNPDRFPEHIKMARKYPAGKFLGGGEIHGVGLGLELGDLILGKTSHASRY